MTDRPQRTQRIKRMLAQFPCLKGWTMGRVLGEGTVGSVFCVCHQTTGQTKNRKPKCAAAKVQILTNAQEYTLFQAEVAKQRAFAPYAPEVYDVCIVEKREGRKKVTYAVIIMEQIEYELDTFLSKRRRVKELQEVKDGLDEIWKFIVRRRISQADSALFNICMTHDGRWILIDFDRASTTVFAPEVDALRMAIEMNPSTRSRGTKKLNKDNMKWLKKNALPVWLETLGFHSVPQRVKDYEAAWVRAYEKYCRKAKVKCLE